MKKIASGYRLIFGYLGLFLIFIGLTVLFPLIFFIFYPEEISSWYCFVIPGVSALAVGITLFLLIAKREHAKLQKHQDAILIVLIWLVAILVSAVPFILKGDLDFTKSIFETTSAYGTVGLTVYNDACYASHVFTLYRAILCFVGGIGLVLIVTSAISDRYGIRLYIAEGHNDKLMPNLAASARLILSIYFVIIALGVGAYCLAGMSPYDAIVHSISATSTSGFSSRPEGLLAFETTTNYGAVQLITVFLMLAGSLNFLLHLLLITGKFKKFFKDCELKFFLILFVLFVPLVWLSAYANNNWTNGLDCLRTSAFTFISGITTTGFTNASSMISLGQAAILIFVITNIIGGGMGSTAGGVKQYRIILVFKHFYWSVVERLSPSNMIYTHYVYRLGKEKTIDDQEVYEASGYLLLYISVLFFGTIIMSIVGSGQFDFGSALFEFSNAISGTGFTNGITATCSAGIHWILIAGMFLGRLEILAIFFALYRVGRDILRKETR